MLVDTGLGRDMVTRETDKAFCFAGRDLGVIRNGARQFAQVWLPKSQITWLADDPRFAETAHVPAWLARKI